MWKVDPYGMCKQHLLGEHVELHMFVGSLLKGKNLKGYFDRGLLEVHSIVERHQELAAEMTRRGMKHSSPLPEFNVVEMGAVDANASEQELRRRCAKCDQRFSTKEQIPQNIRFLKNF